jgi:dihydrofolate reductase
MGRLIYAAITSLDGCVEDTNGRFDWGTPDEEVFCFVSDLERRIGTYLYGRRMYETMLFWEKPEMDEGTPESFRDFTRIWQAAEKIVYSRTLESPSSSKTRIERDFRVGAIRTLKSTTSHDLTVSGADLAGQAIGAGLVDEIQQFVAPVIVGGGKPWLPRALRLNLELLDCTRFASGFVFLKYRLKPGEFDPPR